MKNYDFKLNNLLKKYKLFIEFDDRSICSVVREIIKQKIERKKQYVLFADLVTDEFFDEPTIKKNIIYEYLIEDIDEQNFEQLENNEKYDGIIICSYYIKKEFKDYIKNKYNNVIIIDILEHIHNCIKLPPISVYTSFILKEIIFKEKCLNLIGFNDFIKNKKNYIKDKIKVEPVVIIFGGGTHTQRLLKYTNIINELNIKYIVDSNCKINGEKINGVEIINKNKLNEIDFNTFLISSFSYKEEIKSEIKNVYNDKCIIDLYENDNLWGNVFLSEGYLDEDIKEECKIYIDLIEIYLSIRDFRNANKYINKYIERKYDDYQNLKLFLAELNLLLDQMEEEIKEKNTSNIQFLMFDALDKYGADKYMSFITKMGKENITFSNAFSPSTYTAESHLCIFREKYLFEENNFIREVIEKNECNFILELEKLNYKFVANHPNKYIDKLFEIKIYDEIEDLLDEKRRPISKLLWDNLCYILLNKEQKIFLYSRFMENHDFRGEDVYKYVDSQIEYYSKFFNNNDYIIILSDHGIYDEDTERRINIPIIIKGPNAKKMNIKVVFSAKDIGNVIIDLVKNCFHGAFTNEYINIERTPIYNEITKKNYNKKYIQGFRIIHSVNEKFIVFDDGTEEYYILSNEKENLIYDEKYIQRIQQFREINRKEGFPNFKVDSVYYN